MNISFYILHSFCLSKIVLLGVLFLFPLSVYSYQVNHSGSINNPHAPYFTCKYYSNTFEANSYTMGSTKQPAPSGFVFDYLNYFVVATTSCSYWIDTTYHTNSVSNSASGTAAREYNGRIDYNCCPEGEFCTDIKGTTEVSVFCDFVGYSPTLPSCSNFFPVVDNRCKGGQGLRLQTDTTIALNIIGAAFGEISPVENNSSHFQTLSGAVFLEDISNSQSLLPDTVTRSDGSKCVNNSQGNGYLVCPFGFEAPPEDTTSYGSCPAEPVPMALRKSVQDNYEEKETAPGYTLPWKSKFYYDALGRKTQDNPNTRRYLFEANKNKSPIMEIEPETKGFLLRDNPSGQCCVKTGSFKVGLRDDGVRSTIIDDKVGVQIGFNAEFGQDNGCNPACCEYRQSVKAKIIENGMYKTGGNCGILDSTKYIPDCYGRSCNNSFETYDDALGIYRGTDYPGLNNVSISDTVDILMEFNSYIMDKCNAYEVKESKYWGFHLYGDFSNDSLGYTLLGELNK